MRSLTTSVIVFVICGFAAGVNPALAQTRPPDFGQQWVRQHPVTLMGLQRFPETLKMDKYQGANFNTMLAWSEGENAKATAQAAYDVGMPWHAHIHDGANRRFSHFSSTPGSAGWLVGDEVPRTQMTTYGNFAAEIKVARPNDIVYTQMWPDYASVNQLYGGTPPRKTGYSYSKYLDDVVSIIKPDVLMYDHYPFITSATRHPTFFQNLMTVRAKAKQHNLPYWAFAQSWQAYTSG